ncbi:MAG: T9SS type A sorting domain-containing protein [Bacteroidota bacterium]
MKKLLLLIAVVSTLNVLGQTKWIKVNSRVGGTMIKYSLYQKQTDNSYALIKTKDEDSGMWTFDSLSTGMYRLHASMDYAKYIPTWHPMKAIWDEAMDIDLTAKDTALCDEGMLPNPSFSGPAAINGELSEGMLKTAGDPLKNVRVVIKTAAGAFVKMTSTNDSGKFTAANLPVGTYKILVDMINIPTANAKTVVLDSSNLNATVDLTVNSTGTVNTGILNVTQTGTGDLVLYPNPATDFVTVNSADNVLIAIYNITGTLVAEEYLNQFKQLSISDLPNGMYVVSMVTNGAVTTQRLLKQ